MICPELPFNFIRLYNNKAKLGLKALFYFVICIRFQFIAFDFIGAHIKQRIEDKFTYNVLS